MTLRFLRYVLRAMHKLQDVLRKHILREALDPIAVVERIGSSVRPGNAGQEGSNELIGSRNLVSRPAGAKPAWPGVSPPEPVVSLTTGAATRPAKRRCASAWAVGNAATKSMNIPGAESAELLEGDDAPTARSGRGRLGTRRSGRPRHARHEDDPVTWEAHVSPRNNPVVRETRLTLSDVRCVRGMQAPAAKNKHPHRGRPKAREDHSQGRRKRGSRRTA